MKKYHKLNVKIGAFFLVLVVLVAVGLGTLLYRITYSDVLDLTSKRLIRCGNYVNNVINKEMVDRWLKNGKDGDYSLTEIELEAIQSVFDLSYIFVYRPNFDAEGKELDEVTFVFDLNPVGDTKDVKRKLGEAVTKRKEYEEISKVIETGEPQISDTLKKTEDGSLLTAFVPLKDDYGKIYAIIGVSCRMENVHNIATRSSIVPVIVVVLVIILFAVILLLFLHRRVIRPVKLLSSRMDHFVTNEADFNNNYITEIHTHDEIEQMADNFNSMADSITRYTADLKEITASRERLRAELDVAGSIRSAVSAENTFSAFAERSDFELSASLKNTVYNSCSFCNYFLTDENHLFIVLGESVGKSLPSMLMSMLAATNICALAKMGVEPHKIAYETNNSLCGFERNDIGMTVSALIAKIDLSIGEMKYVNAGMPPVIIKRTGEAYTEEEKGMQFNLGEMHGVSFEQKTLRLNQGTTLFLTSYGVSELKNASGEVFSHSRLTRELNEIAGRDYPLDLMIGELERRMDAFRGNTPIELDTTILGFRYLG